MTSMAEVTEENNKLPSPLNGNREERQFLFIPHPPQFSEELSDRSYYYDNPYYKMWTNPVASPIEFNNDGVWNRPSFLTRTTGRFNHLNNLVNKLSYFIRWPT